ncbi:DUF1308 domain-containing protein [Nostoc sp. 'Lobaria pulmonaria (5183) cyanobiont']|uniref:DUF1308 domain-containing protein n=1 Tax=Nostoc sp. 'Lobaria pulmonaria (5183) cyanobiont' TaxID=1618022 RepID=UPI001F1C68EA|nr:DUF1308 domain-containing protein [Nostoc sp. 'Lobaria pulmonaria (5183) cyanobiont']
MVNLDTGTVFAFISEGSPVRYELRQYVQGQQMLITQTALKEVTDIIQWSGGVSEQAK